MKSKHRGPDCTKDLLINENIYVVFHRLAINDLSNKGN